MSRLEVVQGHLGHSSYAITADIYSHGAPVRQRELARPASCRLDRAVATSNPPGLVIDRGWV